MKVTGIPAALLLAVAWTATFGSAGARAGEAGDTFCQGELLRAYEAPPEGLPRTVESPSGVKLGWASRRLSFHREDDELVVGGDPISYELGLGGAKYGDLHLGWRVESDLVRMDGDGRPRGVARRRVDWIGDITPSVNRVIGFRRSPRPGLYRYDLSFVRDGKSLAHYRDYYRVVRRSTDVRLALNGSSFQAGEQVLGKVENPGTESLFYGFPYSLERYDGSTWLPVDLSALFGRPFGFILVGLGIGSGWSDDCSSELSVPTSMSPGLYRMVKHVEFVRSRPGRDRSRSLTAEFTIVPPA